MREADDMEIMKRLIDALSTAAGCAHQLTHAQQNPNWLTVRDMLEQIKRNCASIGLARALTRQQVLQALDKREMGRA